MDADGRESCDALSIAWCVRRINPGDLAEVLAIESIQFDFPWTRTDFVRCLRVKSHFGIVAATGPNYTAGRVLGFAIYAMKPTRLDLMNIAVAPDVLRLGIGESLIDEITKRLRVSGRSCLTATVRERNTGALLFFRKAGFRVVATLRGVYEETDEDAYVAEYRLPRVGRETDPETRRCDHARFGTEDK
jgi:ribosomal protein S18 acetylase RimI-like enzyme